jgi:ribosomal protein S14
LRKKRKFKKFTYKKIFKVNNIKKHRNIGLLKSINKGITYKNDLFLNRTVNKNQYISNLKNFKTDITFYSKKLKISKTNKNSKSKIKFLNKKRFYFKYLNKKFQQLYKISRDLNIENNSFIKSKFYITQIINNQNNDILVQQSVKNRIVNKKILANNIKNLIKNKRKFIRTVEKRITSDFKKRKVYLNFENNRLILKALIRNTKLSIKIRKNFYSKLLNFPKNSAKTRIRNRCVITGRGRAVYRDLKISRLMLRSLGNFGILPGISKSTW